MKCWDYYFKKIQPYLQDQAIKGKVILPAQSDCFRAFELGLPSIKVVIVGQDPYPNKEHANGLAFSVPAHIKPYPGSLRNIFQELSEDLGTTLPRTGDLLSWSRNGVLLLNTALTVEEGKPGSHLKLWERFTYETLRTVSEARQPIAWMLWGKQAQQYEALIKPHHLKLVAGHPSPISSKLFFGCKHFSKAAEFLKVNPQALWSL